MSLFSQALSMIDDDDFQSLPDSEEQIISDSAIIAKDGALQQDKLNTAPIAGLEQSFGGAVSPFLRHALKKTNGSP